MLFRSRVAAQDEHLLLHAPGPLPRVADREQRGGVGGGCGPRGDGGRLCGVGRAALWGGAGCRRGYLGYLGRLAGWGRLGRGVAGQAADLEPRGVGGRVEREGEIVGRVGSGSVATDRQQQRSDERKG